MLTNLHYNPIKKNLPFMFIAIKNEIYKVI